MSSMLRKGGKSFKPSVRPRPNATRPSSSQPATRPGSETQLHTLGPASQPSNPIPTLSENVAGEEASQVTISQPIQVTPQSQQAPQVHSKTPLTTSNNENSTTIDNTTKRKVRENEDETPAQIEQPPSKVRKLTPPSEQVQHSENNAPSQMAPAASTIPSAASDQSSKPAQHTASQTVAVSPSSNTQGSIPSSRNEQEHAAHKELSSISPSTTENATNTTIDTAQNDSPSADVSVPEKTVQTRNSESEKNSQDTLLGFVAAPAGTGKVVDETIQAPSSSEDMDLSGMGAGEASQTSHLVSTATSTSEETPTPVDEEAAPAAKKARKKAAPRKKKVQLEDGEESRTEVEIQLNRKRRTPRQKGERKKKKGGGAPKTKKDREGTPEDAENEVIEPTTMKMGDLCSDIRIGKKFSKHDEIKQRHTRKKIDAQLAERPELAGLINNTPSEGRAGPREEPAEEPATIVNNNGVQMRVIDGQIVLDDRSLQVDRQRQARDEGLVLEEIEENEFTRAVNSGQYMKRAAGVRWDGPANELFYQGLRQFGTAFEMIAAMFPDRNRRQIKLKFVREERKNPAQVDWALKGKTDEIDFEEYTQLTGQKFEDSAEIQAEHQRLEDEHNAEEEKVAAAKLAADKKKKEAIANAARRGKGGAAGASDGEDGPESQKENAGAVLTGMTKKKPAKSKKSNKASMQGGGEEIEILGTV